MGAWSPKLPCIGPTWAKGEWYRMYTRAQYVSHEVSHQDYYKDMADYCGVGNFDKALLTRVNQALSEGDRHLNTIPLAEWDAMVHGLQGSVRRKVKEYDGYGLTLATGVCMLKAKARHEAQQLDN